MTKTPTGRMVGEDLRLERTFDVPVGRVWSAISESDELERWIGRYEGDPASGKVDFYMTAEGEGPAQVATIDACEEPRLLAVTQGEGEQGWRLRVDLEESDAGTTRLAFTHLALAPDTREMVGPGWEYYLDRLGAVLVGDDVATIDWDGDYYPAMCDYYRDLA